MTEPTIVSTLPRDLRAGDQVIRSEWAGPFPIDRVRTIRRIVKLREFGVTKYKLSFDDGRTSIVTAKDRWLKVVQTSSTPDLHSESD